VTAILLTIFLPKHFSASNPTATANKDAAGSEQKEDGGGWLRSRNDGRKTGVGGHGCTSRKENVIQARAVGKVGGEHIDYARVPGKVETGRPVGRDCGDRAVQLTSKPATPEVPSGWP
jgi:hypothetical protein